MRGVDGSSTPLLTLATKTELVVEFNLAAIADQQLLAEQAQQHCVLGVGKLGVQLQSRALEVLHR